MIVSLSLMAGDLGDPALTVAALAASSARQGGRFRAAVLFYADGRLSAQ
jgi:hypothetical protein